MKGYRLKGYSCPARQARRWEAQADAWSCPNGCGHDTVDHREYASKWNVGSDFELVEVKHPRYRPGLFACHVDGCSCEHQVTF